MNKPLIIAVLCVLLVGIAASSYVWFIGPMTPGHMRQKGFLFSYAMKIQEDWPDSDSRNIEEIRQYLAKLVSDHVSWSSASGVGRGQLMVVTPPGDTTTKIIVIQSNGSEGLSVTRRGLQEVDAQEVMADIGRGDLSVLGYAHHR